MHTMAAVCVRGVRTEYERPAEAAAACPWGGAAVFGRRERQGHEDPGKPESRGLMVHPKGGRGRTSVNLNDHLCANKVMLLPKGEEGFETRQQQVDRELQEARSYFAQKGCLHMANDRRDGSQGSAMAVTGRFIKSGSLRKRPHMTTLETGKLSPASVTNATSAATILSGGGALGQRRAMSAPYLPGNLMRTARSMSVQDVANDRPPQPGDVNYNIMRMLYRSPTGGFFSAGTFPAAAIARNTFD